MFKKLYSLYSAFCTQPAFYSQSTVCILLSVCILPLVRSLQSAVRSLRFTLTESSNVTKFKATNELRSIRISTNFALASVVFRGYPNHFDSGDCHLQLGGRK